ncbi:hypothetical protein J8273_1198 [Carpediemonas membranifera]|uniref:Uncharacterized protein n=1 Tax=Carpediemonas membranifera TaxID=201153 RepID=A0A8J6E4K0_9EUKA|nr:hypothetical protein J8273_1198 [Carpediemonas membranifera]|eukprot:KAG9397283.1 hypothetical protein J8273_1198 [Carpediemonas membranifera]
MDENEKQTNTAGDMVGDMASIIFDGVRNLRHRVEAIGDHLDVDKEVVEDLQAHVAQNASIVKAANAELSELSRQILSWGCGRCCIVMLVPLVIFVVGFVCRVT